jgi:hypothetical protein
MSRAAPLIQAETSAPYALLFCRRVQLPYAADKPVEISEVGDQGEGRRRGGRRRPFPWPVPFPPALGRLPFFIRDEAPGPFDVSYFLIG